MTILSTNKDFLVEKISHFFQLENDDLDLLNNFFEKSLIDFPNEENWKVEKLYNIGKFTIRCRPFANLIYIENNEFPDFLVIITDYSCHDYSKEILEHLKLYGFNIYLKDNLTVITSESLLISIHEDYINFEKIYFVYELVSENFQILYRNIGEIDQQLLKPTNKDSKHQKLKKIFYRNVINRDLILLNEVQQQINQINLVYEVLEIIKENLSLSKITINGY